MRLSRDEKERRLAAVLPLCVPPAPATPEELVARGELALVVAERVLALPFRERDVFVGRFLDGKTFGQIGGELGLSGARIQQIAAALFVKLRAAVGRAGYWRVPIDDDYRRRAFGVVVVERPAAPPPPRPTPSPRRRREIRDAKRRAVPDAKKKFCDAGVGHWYYPAAGDGAGATRCTWHRPGGREERRKEARELRLAIIEDPTTSATTTTTTRTTTMAKEQAKTYSTDDPFDDIDDATPSSGGVYFEPGNYLVEVTLCKRGKTRQQKPFFVAETIILLSDNPRRRPGSRCSWMVMLDNPESPALGNVRQFCATASTAATGETVPLSAMKKAEVLEIVSERNPLAGVRLRASAHNIETKKKAEFTVVDWSVGLPGDDKVQVPLGAAAPPEEEREPGAGDGEGEPEFP